LKKWFPDILKVPSSTSLPSICLHNEIKEKFESKKFKILR